MDRLFHPYTPNAGAPPRFLAGRGAELEDFRILLKRLANGYTDQSLIVTGLRGVGKGHRLHGDARMMRTLGESVEACRRGHVMGAPRCRAT